MKTKLRYFCILLALFAGVHQAVQAQNLFEASSGNGSVYEFTTNGVQSTFVSGLHSPHGLAFDSAGDLFVADTGSGNILEFTNNGATPSSTYVIFATLQNPDGLVFDSAGNLFASDYSTGDIYEFTNNAGILSTNPAIFASGLNPNAMAFNSAGILFAGNGTPSHIYEFTTNGVQSTFVSGLGNTYGLAFDSAGNLFAANSGATTILEFTNNAGTLSTNSITLASGLGNPFGLAFNNAGILFVGDNSDGFIYEYTTNGVQSTFVHGSASFSVGLAFQPAPVASVPFTYITNNGSIAITGYTGSGGAVTIPSTINGYPVTSIFDGGNSSIPGGNSITSLILPNSVTNIGNYAFENCGGLTNVFLGNGVITIGDFSFSGCGITSITIPDSVTGIGNNAFFSCTSLTSATISASVTSIGVAALYDCTSLTNIIVDGANPDFSSLNGVLFDKTQTTLIQFPAGLGGSYTIPNSVTGIGAGAFIDCDSLTNVTVPDSVTSIGGSAFDSCSDLKSVYFLGNAPTPSNDSSVFFGDSSAVAYYLQGATGWGTTFDGIPTSVILPPAPALGMSTYGGRPAVFFPTATGTNYVLQMTTNLTPPINWVTVSNGVPISGVIITNQPADAFFRLH